MPNIDNPFHIPLITTRVVRLNPDIWGPSVLWDDEDEDQRDGSFQVMQKEEFNEAHQR